jgi:hypothetical protein
MRSVERHSEEAKQVVRDIRRAVRRQYSAEEKVRIVIAGLRGGDPIWGIQAQGITDVTFTNGAGCRR